MTIRLETARRTGIVNMQGGELHPTEIGRYAQLAKKYPDATPRRADASTAYNCHGLTFASRRTRVVEPNSVRVILADDGWQEVDIADTYAGDIVVYYGDEGDANHSGIVVGKELNVPMICSKWGHGGEFIHSLNYCPDIYGPQTKFYRCRL